MNDFDAFIGKTLAADARTWFQIDSYSYSNIICRLEVRIDEHRTIKSASTIKYKITGGDKIRCQTRMLKVSKSDYKIFIDYLTQATDPIRVAKAAERQPRGEA